MNGPASFNWTGMLVLAICVTAIWLRMVVRDLRTQKKEREAQR
jgi:ABC-type transport system involved in cytochrome bd biosynthesis fused ATPase/permease subunit